MTNKLHTYFFLLVAVILFFSTLSQITYAQITVPVVEDAGPLLTTTEEIRDAVSGLGSMLGLAPPTAAELLANPSLFPDTTLATDAANLSSIAHLLSDTNPAGIAQVACEMKDVEDFMDISTFKYGAYVGTPPYTTTGTTTYNTYIALSAEFEHARNIIEALLLREFPGVDLTNITDTQILARRESLADEYIDLILTLYYLPIGESHAAYKDSGFGTYSTEINASGSLRCLLQELVQWKKLSLNLTIHQMVKEYFADSGVYIMTKRVQDLIAAATTEWAQSGIEQTIAPGVIANTSAFVDNPEAQQRRANTAIRGGVLAQIQGGAAGYQSYNLPSDNQQYIYNSVTINTADSVLDNLETFPNKVADNASPEVLTSRRALASGDFAAGGGTGGYIDYMFSTNNPIVASVEITNNTKLEMAKANENSLRQLDWGSGVLPTETCANPSDPYCRVKRVNTPASVNSVNIQEVQLMGWNNLANADEFGENPSPESQSLQVDVVTTNRGLLGYDTRNLRSPLIDPIDKLKQGNAEFIDTIEYYFDVTDNTKNWAVNSVLYTWDTVQAHAGLEEYLANGILLGNL